MTPWNVAHQGPVSMGFPQQEYWGGLPFPYPEDLPDPGIEPTSTAWQVDTLPLGHQGAQEWYPNEKVSQSLVLTSFRGLHSFWGIVSNPL